MFSVSFFFFKQKTAYEMRISDWSSDVCSSDLNTPEHHECPALPSRGTRDARAYLAAAGAAASMFRCAARPALGARRRSHRRATETDARSVLHAPLRGFELRAHCAPARHRRQGGRAAYRSDAGRAAPRLERVRLAAPRSPCDVLEALATCVHGTRQQLS